MVPISGFSEWGRILIIGWGCTFPVWISTHYAILERDTKFELVAFGLGMSKWTVRRRVIWPTVLPGFLSGARLGLGVGWLCIVASEMVGAIEDSVFDHGVGMLLWEKWTTSQMHQLGFAILLLGTLGLLSDALFRLLTQHRLSTQRKDGWH